MGKVLGVDYAKGIPINFNDETKEADEEASKRSLYGFLLPLVNEFAILRGIIIQLFFAVRDIVFLPLSILPPFKKNLSSEKQKYNSIVAFCFLTAFIGIHASGITFEWFVQQLGAQRLYPMKGTYTLSYVLMKHLSKVHDFCHKSLRGAIRDKKPIITPVILYTLYIVISYIAHLFQICVVISGLYQAKPTAFMFSMVYVQVINYKKFMPKFASGNQLIQESFYRLSAIIAAIYHYEMTGIDKAHEVLKHEYRFALFRILLVCLTCDYVDWKKNLKKDADRATLELTGNYNDNISKSTYIVCYHESLAIILTMFLRLGTQKFRICVAAAIAVITIASVVLPKMWMKCIPEESVTEKEKKD